MGFDVLSVPLTQLRAAFGPIHLHSEAASITYNSFPRRTAGNTCRYRVVTVTQYFSQSYCLRKVILKKKRRPNQIVFSTLTIQFEQILGKKLTENFWRVLKLI